MEIPEGFTPVESTAYRRGHELLVVCKLEPEGSVMFGIRLGQRPEDLGPPPDGFEWTGESARRGRASSSGRRSREP
jgi:hypothetical protein